jgi:pimeloyl-ACP methyl ester carboxylesterase
MIAQSGGPRPAVPAVGKKDAMPTRVLFLGGNGHCAARLGPAREALARLTATGQVPPIDLLDVPCPGFEDRPRAPNFDAFLDTVAGHVQASAQASGTILYGTGIGGLVLLCLRARGEATELPVLLQAPVLWGLEHRLMPRVMRRKWARPLLRRLFASRFFQAAFVRRYFRRRPKLELRVEFFAGYARCPAAADFFDWLNPGLLRELEATFRAQRHALKRITVWWGERDRVVTLRELGWTGNALGVRWPLRVFREWGHYPMMDDPEGWVRALADAVADAGPVPRRGGAEAG